MFSSSLSSFFFFFNDTATTEIYTLSLHDALPIFSGRPHGGCRPVPCDIGPTGDRKSTRLNSSHRTISYAVFCLKKKKRKINTKLRKNITNNHRHNYTYSIQQ